MTTTSQTKTILLVDDDAMTMAFEAMFLKDNGFAVLTAASGEEAIAAAIDPSVDLVLMDIDLGPGIDGTEAAERILAQRDVPLIFLSSHTEAAIVEKTERITSYGYILKTSSGPVLLASIRMAFRLYEAREKTVEQERVFLALFEQSPVSIQVFDISGITLQVNHAWETLWDFPKDKIEGCFNVLEDTYTRESGWRDLIARAFAGETVLIPAMEFDPARSGYAARKRILRCTVFPIMLHECIHRVVMIHEDITDLMEKEAELIAARDAAEKSRDQLGQLLEYAPDAFFQGDQTGRIIAVNIMAVKLTGYPRGELLGKNLAALFPPDELIARPLDYARLAAGEILTVTRRIRRKDGTMLEIEMCSARMPDGTYQSFFRNIDERTRSGA